MFPALCCHLHLISAFLFLRSFDLIVSTANCVLNQLTPLLGGRLKGDEEENKTKQEQLLPGSLGKKREREKQKICISPAQHVSHEAKFVLSAILAIHQECSKVPLIVAYLRLLFFKVLEDYYAPDRLQYIFRVVSYSLCKPECMKLLYIELFH